MVKIMYSYLPAEIGRLHLSDTRRRIGPTLLDACCCCEGCCTGEGDGCVPVTTAVVVLVVVVGDMLMAGVDTRVTGFDKGIVGSCEASANWACCNAACVCCCCCCCCCCFGRIGRIWKRRRRQWLFFFCK